MTFALRHTTSCGCREFMDSRGILVTKLASAVKFTTLEDAKTYLAGSRGGANYDIVEITWGLRWYINGAPATAVGVVPYYASRERKDARRYDSPSEVRALLKRCGFAHENYDDTCSGYRVVRFTKIVSKGA